MPKSKSKPAPGVATDKHKTLTLTQSGVVLIVQGLRTLRATLADPPKKAEIDQLLNYLRLLWPEAYHLRYEERPE